MLSSLARNLPRPPNLKFVYIVTTCCNLQTDAKIVTSTIWMQTSNRSKVSQRVSTRTNSAMMGRSNRVMVTLFSCFFVVLPFVGHGQVPRPWAACHIEFPKNPVLSRTTKTTRGHGHVCLWCRRGVEANPYRWRSEATPKQRMDDLGSHKWAQIVWSRLTIQPS